MRWTAAVSAAVVGLSTGCSPSSGAADPGSSPSGPTSSPSPPWSAVGGSPVPSPEPEASRRADRAVEEPVEPVDLPASCAAAGVKDPMADIAAELTRPEFTEVRGDSRLECSWAGYDQKQGSQVVMVTIAPDRSRVEYPGHVPPEALSDPDYFTTPGVRELGGIAEWESGEMFSGVNLHLPGLRMSITSSSETVDTGELLDVGTEVAGGLVERGRATPSPRAS